MKTIANQELDIVKKQLTWGHKITLIGLAMSGALMAVGIVLLVLYPTYANEIIEYVSTWLPFCISVILGYSAKTTVENGMKIYSAVKDRKKETTEQNGGNG